MAVFNGYSAIKFVEDLERKERRLGLNDRIFYSFISIKI